MIKNITCQQEDQMIIQENGFWQIKNMDKARIYLRPCYESITKVRSILNTCQSKQKEMIIQINN